MKVYEVEPLRGIGAIRLGMARTEVRTAMSETPDVSGSRNHVDNFHDGGLQVFYDLDDKVEFIEMLRGAGLSAITQGIDVFAHTAKDVLKIITKISEYNQDDLEVGYSYVFPDLELSLWRPNIPKSDLEEDGKYFSTIGIGVQGYYSATIGE
ncbi:MAG: hypothetical protein R3B47_13895 [Bacteroidia bacterium]